MSYDIWLGRPETEADCEHCGGTGKTTVGGEYDESPTDWNYTSNCAWMWREAGADLASFDGDQAKDWAPLLKAAIDVLESEPERFREGNPKNGWGDYNSLVERLKVLLGQFEEHPDLIVRVSR